MPFLDLILMIIGSSVALVGAAGMAYAARQPGKELWPPKEVTPLSLTLVWGMTGVVVACAAVLIIRGWGDAALPVWLRGSGLVLILVGNAFLVSGLRQFTASMVSGAAGTLKTGGGYQVSRNPQYLGDSLLFIGWALLSAAPWSWPVLAAATLAVLLAPFAEEPWLRAQYGEEFDHYCAKVPRYWLPF